MTTSDLAYLCRALRVSGVANCAERVADIARDKGWSYEQFLCAVLEKEMHGRQSSGAETRIRCARFPGRKSLEDFDFDHQRSLKREIMAHLSALDFVVEKSNVVMLGPPGTGKTHLAIGLGIKACIGGHKVAFATAAQWVRRLSDADRKSVV